MTWRDIFKRGCEIVAWAGLLPFLGFAILAVLSAGVAAILFAFAPGQYSLLILQAGFVPSLVPASLMVGLRGRVPGVLVAAITMLGSALAAMVWWMLIANDSEYFSADRMWIIPAIAAAAAGIMCLTLVPRQVKPRAIVPGR